MSLFGDLEIRNDPWNPEYGSEMPAASAEHEDSSKALSALDVEVPANAWAPVTPPDVPLPAWLAFVDGVRRIEHRVIVGRSGMLYHGAFGSFAVGAVIVQDGRARFQDSDPSRVLAAGIDTTNEGTEFAVRPALRYRFLRTKETDEGLLGTGAVRGVDAPLRAIHDEMRTAEERLGRELAGSDDATVVMDGPLTFESKVRGAAIGYIKRITYFYIPEALHGVLAALTPGTRTPLFALQSSKRFSRYSWFVRLDHPGPGDSEHSGLVRMEVSQDGVTREEAIHLANLCARHIPRFASVRGLDPRAPQNLVPVGALESRLRRQLGDVSLINRYIRAAIAQERRRA